MKKLLLPIAIIALLVLGGCTKKAADKKEDSESKQSTQEQSTQEQTTPAKTDTTQKKTETDKQIGMVNPASQYCEKNGGKLETKKNGKGDEYGVCVFADNQQCEEWAFFRGFCPKGGVKITGYTTPASAYCAILGGEYKVSKKTAQEEKGNCTFKNGAECDAQDIYDAKCPMHFNEPATSWVYKKYDHAKALIGYQDQVIKLIEGGQVHKGENKPQLIVDAVAISNIPKNATLGYDHATAKKDQNSLAKADYGAEIDMPVKDSKKVVKIYPNTHGKEFMVLGRFDTCDVTFERTVIFYNNDHRVKVTLYGNKDEIIKENHSYFRDSKKCNGKVWNYEKSNSIREDFEKDLKSGKINSGNATESWYGQFGMIVETIAAL